MERGSTIFLRGVIVLMGTIMFALCAIGLPAAIGSDNTGYYKPILFGLYVPAIPFFIALHQALKLLGYIDKNKVFSPLSVAALKNIKLCAAAICGLFALGMPYIFVAADRDDAPGVILMALIIGFTSFVIATFAAVLQKLLQSAADIKSENDLTV